MFAAGWWISVVGGLALVAYALVQTIPALGDADAAFWVIAGLLLFFEFSPVIIGSGYDSQGVATSDAFTFAILYLYGPWPAIALDLGGHAGLGAGQAQAGVEGALQHRAVRAESWVSSSGHGGLAAQSAVRPCPTLAVPLTGLAADRHRLDGGRLAHLLLRQQHALLDVGRPGPHLRRRLLRRLRLLLLHQPRGPGGGAARGLRLRASLPTCRCCCSRSTRCARPRRSRARRSTRRCTTPSPVSPTAR